MAPALPQGARFVLGDLISLGSVLESFGPAFGVTCALASALAWTLINLIVRALSPPFPTLSLNIIRSALGGIALVGIVIAGSGPQTFTAIGLEMTVYLALTMLLAVGVGDTAFFESTRILGLARAMTLSTSYPLMAAALAVWLLDEPFTPRHALGALFTLGGLAVIVGERAKGQPEGTVGSGRGRGVALALLAAAAWAVSALLLKPVLFSVDPVTAQAVRLPVAAAILWVTPWARGTGRLLWRHGPTTWRLIAWLGVLTALSSVSFVAGLKYAGVGVGSVLSSTSPLFALPIAFLAFREPVTARATIGALLAVAGIAVVSL
jgi:drug/metabolite transporter (DMT)-like permease